MKWRPQISAFCVFTVQKSDHCSRPLLLLADSIVLSETPEGGGTYLGTYLGIDEVSEQIEVP